MAQTPVTLTIHVDTAAARRKLRRMAGLTRELNAELARLDVQLAALEERREALAEYGIKLEVSGG